MANRATVTYNGATISTEDRDGSFSATYDGSTIATVAAGQTKTLNCANQVMKTNVIIGGKTLNCAKYKMATNLVISVVSLFPSEPSAYNLIGTYTSSQTWTAPEDGYFQIEVFGASGSGGAAYAYYRDNKYYYWGNGGGGGGGGGYACSRIKMKAGEVLALVAGSVGADSSATINSSLESYSVMTVTSGVNGTGASMPNDLYEGKGGAGGVASGGNVANANGGAGSNGGHGDSGRNGAGGAGGAAGYTGGNAGGVGGTMNANSGATSPGSGSAGFIKIYRGNTNVA